jgi:non-specific serine/threonine protein kinase
MIGRQLGQYRVLDKLGEGGMGTVYEAFDERLERKVALKVINPELLDANMRKRFWREARTAAGVSHPNLCQLFDVVDHDGDLCLAMELLQGETLAGRLTRGPLSVRDTVDVTLGVLAALQALHEREIVHRDVKPANLFLTPHGVKLLDFGLSTRVPNEMLTAVGVGSAEPLTLPGLLLGTPSYMAPEQVRGQAVTPVTDLFAVGAMMFEMITGRRAFDGESALDILRAVEMTNPPALTGSPQLVRVDRVLHVACAKQPSERYQSAAMMAQALQSALQAGEGAASAPAELHAEINEVRRLMVLPFRPLRPDADSDFLAISLPDAITHSLSGLDSLVVRTSLVGAKYAESAPDIRRLAVDADVDLVLSGTLLRAGDRLQVTVQLFQTPSGTLLKSHLAQVAFGDIFELQRELVREVVDGLELKLSANERRNMQRDIPANARAYELYLRANEAASRPDRIPEAIALYEECLGLDAGFAPAMARLGRCYRYRAKYHARDDEFARAESMLQRAIDINSSLGIAHSVMAQLETDRGEAQDAVARLLGCLKRTPNAPEIYAGLVYACRFCGLLDASVSAHRQAQRISSRVPTSVAQTYFVMGEYERCLETYHDDFGYIGALALYALGREADAHAVVTERQQWRQTPLALSFLAGLRALMEGRLEECVRMVDDARETFHMRGEELFYISRHYAKAGALDKATAAVRAVVETGYFNYPTLATDPWLAPLRGQSAFEEVLKTAEARHRAAEALFLDAAGSFEH